PPSAFDARALHDLAARPASAAPHGARHLPEVADPGLRAPEPRNPRRVRLPLADALGPEPLEPLEAVGAAAALELVEPRELARLGRDHELATALGADAVRLAEPVHRLAALDA